MKDRTLHHPGLARGLVDFDALEHLQEGLRIGGELRKEVLGPRVLVDATEPAERRHGLHVVERLQSPPVGLGQLELQRDRVPNHDTLLGGLRLRGIERLQQRSQDTEEEDAHREARYRQ